MGGLPPPIPAFPPIVSFWQRRANFPLRTGMVCWSWAIFRDRFRVEISAGVSVRIDVQVA